MSATPKYNFGLQLNFAYKGFDLSMLWAGSAGMKYYWNAAGYNSSVYLLYAVSTLIANDHYYYNAANLSDRQITSMRIIKA
ncbi:hypothetical protein CS542_06430 [Pedobacter sp. IW39]|nr:hypothetical protein CS542_06430 [Pedobacter sp. IW39]